MLSDQWKAPFVPAHPYLLTSHEIELFFAAAARLGRSPHGGGSLLRSSR